jgi:hypothetical protein
MNKNHFIRAIREIRGQIPSRTVWPKTLAKRDEDGCLSMDGHSPLIPDMSKNGRRSVLNILILPYFCGIASVYFLHAGRFRAAAGNGRGHAVSKGLPSPMACQLAPARSS